MNFKSKMELNVEKVDPKKSAEAQLHHILDILQQAAKLIIPRERPKIYKELSELKKE